MRLSKAMSGEVLWAIVAPLLVGMVLLGVWEAACRVFQVPQYLLQVTPIVAIAPLIIILVKSTSLSLVICATIIGIFPVISNTIIGLRSVDPGLLSYFRMKKAGRLRTLLRLRIPSALPFFLAGLRISSGLSLIGAVVAEFVAGTGGRNSGLAYLILNAGFQLDIPLMFAALALIAALGIAMFMSMTALSQLVLGHWHESALRATL